MHLRLTHARLPIWLVDNIFVYGAAKYSNLQELATSAVPQTIASQAMLGRAGGIVMSLLTVLASFTTANAYVAGLPRMLYGLAREGQLPKVYGVIHPKYRVPMAGVWTTVFLILITTVIISVEGGTSDNISYFINVACITWLIAYCIAMIDVLVLRKKYPDFPRLFKVPFAKVLLPIGMVGALYSIYCLKYVLLEACIVMAICAAYIIIWNKAKKQPVNVITSLEESVTNIRNRSEYLAVWDEAVEEWIQKQHA